MTRQRIVAGNWKLHKGPAEAAAFCASLREQLPADGACRAVVCPPCVSLQAARDALEGSAIAVFAQNAHWSATGAFTGEVGAEMLLELGVAGAIVGHSERRQLFGDTDATVAARAAHALRAGLEVIACVGELETERAAGETEEVLRRQVGALAEAIDGTARLVIAYEPVWAIGTGRTATPDQAQDAHALVRSLLDVPILYGGSVKEENAAALFAQPDVDGALVGGASLDARSFAAICACGPSRS